MEQKPKNGSGCIIGIIIIILFAIMGSCSDSKYRQNESNAFRNQLNKDPNSWTKEEKTRYNNVVDWSDKQKNK